MIGDGGTPYVGRLALEQFAGPPKMSLADLSAVFAPAGSLYSTLSCPPGATVAGSCCYVSPAQADAGTPGMVSAGQIEFDDNTATVTMMIFGAQGYSDWVYKGVEWRAYDDLALSGTGNTVQAFNTVIVATDEPYGKQATKGSLSVSISSSFVETWTPSTMAGHKVLGRLSTGAHGFVQCIVDDAAGTMSFPASLMSAFSASDVGNLDVGRVAIMYASAPNAAIELTAITGERATVQYAP
jgi:hypothetical protein